MAQRTADKSRLDKRQSDEARASAERHIAWLDEEIIRLGKAYRSLLQSSPALSETAALYQSVPGLGQLTAATLVAELPELGRIDDKMAVALAGLAPWSRDSGGGAAFRAVGAKCGGCCIWQRSRRRGVMRGCWSSTGACGRAANRAKRR